MKAALQIALSLLYSGSLNLTFVAQGFDTSGLIPLYSTTSAICLEQSHVVRLFPREQVSEGLF